jgi:hypothetical protein
MEQRSSKNRRKKKDRKDQEKFVIIIMKEKVKMVSLTERTFNQYSYINKQCNPLLFLPLVIINFET